MGPRWLLPLLLGMPLAAWGPQGHGFVATASLQSLPPAVRAWFEAREPAYARAALEPDLWKAEDPEETSRHRIFCETYGGPDTLPLQAAAARAQVGAWAFAASGQLPWVMADRTRSLVAAFRARDRARVVAEAGWLCHYVADAHVPLHTTRNRNGKLTDQKGVHRRWETDLVARGIKEGPTVQPAGAVADVPRAIAAWIRDSHALVQPLLDADAVAQRAAGDDPEAHLAKFGARQQATVRGQLRRAAEQTGCLILTAWVEAGSPTP